MPLAALLSNQVANAIRNRGRSYFSEGLVKIGVVEDASVSAVVRGSGKYTVDLKLEGDALVVCCDCPYFQRNDEVCKHIWATILASDQHNYPSAALTKSALKLRLEGVDESLINLRNIEKFPVSTPLPHRKEPPTWKQKLARVAVLQSMSSQRGETWTSNRQLCFVIDAAETKRRGEGLIVYLAHRELKGNGDWGKLKTSGLNASEVSTNLEPADQQLIALLRGGSVRPGYSAYDNAYTDHIFSLSAAQQKVVLPMLCATGRCRLRSVSGDQDLPVLRWDEGPAWELWLNVRLDENDNHFVLDASLRRGEGRMSIQDPILLAGGAVFMRDYAAKLNDFGAYYWISLLREDGSLRVPAAQRDELLEQLLACPSLPQLDLPPELMFETAKPVPRPRITLRACDHDWNPDRLQAEISFDYDGFIVTEAAGTGLYQKEKRRRILRDIDAERAASARLRTLGFKAPAYFREEKSGLEVSAKILPHIVGTLLKENWHVEAEGKLYRKSGTMRLEVTSGIDWFELHGGVQFGNASATFPALLAAARRGENTIRLDDGSVGLMPDEWLEKMGAFLGLGKAERTHLKFKKSQAGLLDALLMAQPESTCDATFARVRDELRHFESVEALEPPAGFCGTLRNYQREGLGWFDFLRRFGFGGCLADDMGLGKTVQVLALLESRRMLRQEKTDDTGPSLVVVPKSLVFNWIQEATRFAPGLRVLDHTGMSRTRGSKHFEGYDIILTTYGTLRNDAADFRDMLFDYVILDEAQAVKNANTESAKAVRLLRGRHRLALSGTPIENHIGELWSLFEFLNPGMLGTASVFRGASGRDVSPETRTLLSRALRPFILRRTKDQVARDLPQKLEQTLYCELEPEQRRLYNELRDHYRAALLPSVERDGMGKSKILILEALLRLRQAACHPGLIDKSQTDLPSAKLDVLMPQLAEVLEEGHKVLVFSQFTSFLSIVRQRLDKENTVYEYLDGKTRDRAAHVERFQTDPACKLFLISLKAGGLGLNLTAAEYVYLLDPWWNPAVEAQAIDRAHRIGQTRQVFACRLIARDTVEEKVLELQKSKRDLADAIINADNSLIRDMGMDELQLLLS